MLDGIPAVSLPARFAGGIDPDPALEVIRAAGWILVTAPAGNVHARHPDGQLYAGWLPEFGGNRTWQLQYADTAYAPADWTADLSDDTPTPAVAAYLDALTGDHDAEYDPFMPRTGPGGLACPNTATAAALLTAAGWDIDRRDTRLVEARHGDGDLLTAYGDLAPEWWTLHGRPAPRAQPRRYGWAVLCTVGPGGPEVWQAAFGGEVPMTAVAAFLAAVTDPDPVTRPADELNIHVRARHA